MFTSLKTIFSTIVYDFSLIYHWFDNDEVQGKLEERTGNSGNSVLFLQCLLRKVIWDFRVVNDGEQFERFAMDTMEVMNPLWRPCGARSMGSTLWNVLIICIPVETNFWSSGGTGQTGRWVWTHLIHAIHFIIMIEGGNLPNDPRAKGIRGFTRPILKLTYSRGE